MAPSIVSYCMLHGHDTGTTPTRVIDSRMNLKGKVAMWQQKADQHAEKQKYNFFSERNGCGVKRVIDKNDPNYGRPEAGSKTDLRGQKAQREILKEIRELCEIIDEVGYHKKDGTVIIAFGQLFDLWTVISDKLVGTMLRARKRGLIDFEGEMLFQRRDDHVIVRLVKSMDEINEMFNYTGPRMKLGHVKRHIENELPAHLLD
ncbi:actin-binding Rho-activating protein-like isoform X2 [Varroa jacobsoni]|uniref:Costars domain-containing protein n=1 Tax=Varroa destructor TaxID=109461 RepID=A0A7M7JIT9_VARDE|nr:actin-binding Rho-activating protein-like isoform X2 [Varroa destructor]XP_022702492.1 actin-binding Rho-activating protein-like isoform X2 [Varroa jacobsoni]